MNIFFKEKQLKAIEKSAQLNYDCIKLLLLFEHENVQEINFKNIQILGMFSNYRLSKSLRVLVEKEKLERIPSFEDHRMVYYKLTDKGIEVLKIIKLALQNEYSFE